MPCSLLGCQQRNVPLISLDVIAPWGSSRFGGSDPKGGCLFYRRSLPPVRLRNNNTCVWATDWLFQFFCSWLQWTRMCKTTKLRACLHKRAGLCPFSDCAGLTRRHLTKSVPLAVYWCVCVWSQRTHFEDIYGEFFRLVRKTTKNGC
jgi:hypothetical protein